MEELGISKMNKTLHYSPSDGHKFTGKEISYIIFDEIAEVNIDKKIKWIQSEGRLRLAARAEIQPRGWEVGLTETEMDAVHEWCQEHNCGKRTSFDTFQFRSKKEMTMFLLKWG
jgi:hypothetical protein